LIPLAGGVAIIPWLMTTYWLYCGLANPPLNEMLSLIRPALRFLLRHHDLIFLYHPVFHNG
jgi:hypothetical protein